VEKRLHPLTVPPQEVGGKNRAAASLFISGLASLIEALPISPLLEEDINRRFRKD
jgi:hypothetical protein